MPRYPFVFSLVLVALAVPCIASAVDPPPPMPTSADTAAIERTRVRLVTALRPEVRPKLEAAGRALLARMGAQEDAVRKDPKLVARPVDVLAREVVTNNLTLGNVTNGNDISALAFIVLMEATKGADSDLKAAPWVATRRASSGARCATI
jgi:hypothetical protein